MKRFRFSPWIARRASLAVLFGLQACVSFPDAPAPTVAPAVVGEAIRSVDGALLAADVWSAESPKAIIIALHGMNDYARAFEGPGAWWASHAEITTYAIDQRGFGRSPQFGRWVGAKTLAADLRAVVAAVRARHGDKPVYVLGHSMGAAVVMTAEAATPLDANGLILAAPGVWGGASMPIPYRLALNFAAGVAPGKTLTGERAERQSTDNIEILREMFADPLVIKETRLDAVLGVVRAMGKGAVASDNIDADVLFLIGDKDEIIPVGAMEKAAKRIKNADTRRYENGWHLLFRDLQAEQVWRDVADWILARADGELELSP